MSDLGNSTPDTSKAEVDTGAPQEWKKYSTYAVEVDPDQDDKAKEIKLCNFSRPHMRAFHWSWWAFFMAFFIWFSIAPLMPEIKKTLGLSKKQVWTSNIVGVTGTVFMRSLLGPMVDKYGPRIPFTVVLCAASIPTAATGFVNSVGGLYVLRLFIGIAGGSFVMCQAWTSRMFVKDVVGTANATVAGWGNLGGGVTQLIVGSALFPLFKVIYGGNAEKSWRTVCVIPAAVTFVTGIVLLHFSDDAPKGNYTELKKHGNMPEISAAASFRSGAVNFNTWLLAIQYACSFGVELTMYNAAASYFHDEFGLTTEKAAAIASIFGWLNLFARALGGYLSDLANARWGMRGRLWVQCINLACQGSMVIVFANSKNLSGAIAIMVIFSLFVQMCNGSCFGIVPYVNPTSTGSVSGIVGAGGNVGAIGFGVAFRQLGHKDAFYVMGFTVLGASLTTMLVTIKGYRSALWGKDLIVSKETGMVLSVPQKDLDATEDVNA